MQQFGPVPREVDEPVFHADWERKIFSMMLGLAGQGRFNADQFRAARETIAPARYLTSRYFELWLHAVEKLLVGTIERNEIDARVEELRADPALTPVTAVDPALADRVRRQLRQGYSTAGQAPTPRRHNVGDPVRTRNVHPPGHTRLPRYARDKRGVIEALYPAFPVPDRIAHGLDPRPEHLYCVRFEAQELWGESAERGCEVYVDMWESYLRPEPEDAPGPHLDDKGRR